MKLLYLMSKWRTLQSAPTVAKNCGSGEKLTSKTSLSWAIRVFVSCSELISHIEQVVSILQVMILSMHLGLQSKDVKGAVSSFFCLFKSSYPSQGTLLDCLLVVLNVPNSQDITRSNHQIRIWVLSIRYPHDLCCWILMVELELHLQFLGLRVGLNNLDLCLGKPYRVWLFIF